LRSNSCQKLYGDQYVVDTETPRETRDCRALSIGRMANNYARFPLRLPCLLRLCLPCVLRPAHGNPFALTVAPPLVPFMDVNLCRALKENARQRRNVCRAFVLGAWQTHAFAVRFLLAHGKRFSKKRLFIPALNFSSTSILFCTLYFNYVIISIFLQFLTNFFIDRIFFI
jgi:hypothetical protein